MTQWAAIAMRKIYINASFEFIGNKWVRKSVCHFRNLAGPGVIRRLTPAKNIQCIDSYLFSFSPGALGRARKHQWSSSI